MNQCVNFLTPKSYNRQQNTAANWCIFSLKSENSNLLLDRCLGKMPHNILRAYLCSLQLCLCCLTFKRQTSEKVNKSRNMTSYAICNKHVKSKKVNLRYVTYLMNQSNKISAKKSTFVTIWNI